MNLKNLINVKNLVIYGTLILGSLISLIIFSIEFTFAFIFVWIHKMFYGYSRGATNSFGIEFMTASMILVGVVHGAMIGFIFTFFLITLMDGVAYAISTPLKENWPPFIPGPYAIVDAIATITAAYLVGAFSFFVIGIIVIVLKNILTSIKDLLLYGMPFKPVAIIGITINILILKFFEILFF